MLLNSNGMLPYQYNKNQLPAMVSPIQMSPSNGIQKNIQGNGHTSPETCQNWSPCVTRNHPDFCRNLSIEPMSPLSDASSNLSIQDHEYPRPHGSIVSGIVAVLFCGVEDSFLARNIKQYLQLEFRRKTLNIFLEEIDYMTSPQSENILKELSVVIIIFSSSVLNYMTSKTWGALDKNRVIAVFHQNSFASSPTPMNNNSISHLQPFEEWIPIDLNDTQPSFTLVLEKILANPCWNQSQRFTTENDFTVIPKFVTQDARRVHILFNAPLDDHASSNVVLKGLLHASSVQPKKLNPYVQSFEIPGHYIKTSPTIILQLEINGVFWGEKPIRCINSNLDNLNPLSLNDFKSVEIPLEVISQALHLPSTDRENLDLLLHSKVENCFPVPRLSTDAAENNSKIVPNCAFPTWLHFGAYYGLENFTLELLQVPYAVNCLSMVNNLSKTPSELARGMNFPNLSQDLEDVELILKMMKQADHPTPALPPIANLHDHSMFLDVEGHQEQCIYHDIDVMSRNSEELYLGVLEDNNKQDSMNGDLQRLADGWLKKRDVKSFLLEFRLTISSFKLNINSSNQCEVNESSSGHSVMQTMAQNVTRPTQLELTKPALPPRKVAELENNQPEKHKPKNEKEDYYYAKPIQPNMEKINKIRETSKRNHLEQLRRILGSRKQKK